MNARVLVAYAGKHGATAEIAERIGKVIREQGFQVDVSRAANVGDPSVYQAVVLGSSVYIGMWRKEAARYLKANEAELAKRPVWLFSSGPTGAEPLESLLKGWSFPKGLQPVADRVKPRGVVVFRGAFDAKKAGFFERWVISKVKAPVGDFRDWPAIESWARDIARALMEK
jgi:menaquinone-dependent protoporphyrinogen oxidase